MQIEEDPVQKNENYKIPRSQKNTENVNYKEPRQKKRIHHVKSHTKNQKLEEHSVRNRERLRRREALTGVEALRYGGGVNEKPIA